MLQQADQSLQNDILKDRENPDIAKVFNEKKDYCYGGTCLMALKDSNMIHLESRTGKNVLLMEIIKNKSPDLFLKTKNPHIDLLKLSETSSLKKNNFYVVNDDPKSIINNPTNFSFVNAILKTRPYLCLFDINAVKKDLVSIDNDKSNGIDSLIDGI